MSQQPSVESSKSSPTQSINPALQAALGNLNVELEAELNRYRRQKAGRSVPPSGGLISRKPARQAIDLISVNTAGAKAASVSGRPRPARTTVQQAETAIQTPQTLEPETETEQLNEPVATPNASFDLSDDSSQLAVVSPLEGENDESPDNVAATQHPAVDEEDRNSADRNPVPDDYLESSEQLLRSLAEEEVSIRREPSFLDSLLTPLGVGSMLLLLASTATLGYIVTNPTTLSRLGLDRIWKSTTPTVAQSPNSTSTPATSPSAEKLPNAIGPNLAANEFEDLNLNDLGTLKSAPNASPIPQLETVPNSQVPETNAVPLTPPGVPENSTIPNTTQLSPSPPVQSVVPPIPSASVPSSSTLKTPTSSSPVGTQPSAGATPRPTTSVVPTPVAATPFPNPQGFYYVVANYDSEQSLVQVRKIVPDAYLLPQGNRIQIAAFKKQSEAQRLITELQQQGISASVYQP